MLAESWEWARDMAWAALLLVGGALSLLVVGPLLFGVGYCVRSPRLQDLGFAFFALPLIFWVLMRPNR